MSLVPVQMVWLNPGRPSNASACFSDVPGGTYNVSLFKMTVPCGRLAVKSGNPPAVKFPMLYSQPGGRHVFDGISARMSAGVLPRTLSTGRPSRLQLPPKDQGMTPFD